MSDSASPGPGWWLASDGNWYPPDSDPRPAPPPNPSTPQAPADPTDEQRAKRSGCVPVLIGTAIIVGLLVLIGSLLPDPEASEGSAGEANEGAQSAPAGADVPGTGMAESESEVDASQAAPSTTVSPGGGDVETAALDILWDVYGECFNLPGGKSALVDASVVRTSTEAEGVVTVSVFLQTVATGREATYDFRINTGLGSYRGVPEPGTGIAVNDDAA